MVHSGGKAMTAGPAAGAVWLAWCAGLAAGQVRVAAWNVTNYDTSSSTTSRTADFQTALFATAPNGLRFVPDVLIVNEMVGTTGAAAFLTMLNGGAGSPGDYAMAPYVANSSDPGANPGHALYFRTSKVQLVAQPPSLAQTVMLTSGTGSCSTCPPRDNAKWLVRLRDYNASGTPGTGAEMYLYASHMKAGSTTADQDRRTPEAVRLRNDTGGLPAGANFILGGDFNMQSSGQTAWTRLTETGTNANGRFVDPIASPGSWNNNCSFRWVFTQDPANSSSGGMDDRLDFLLVSASLINGSGLEYIGNPSINYNTAATNLANAGNATPWNVSSHSYRVWGNDGGSCNGDLRQAGNTMVGPTIAAALARSALTTGHLPLYLDVRVPPRASVPTLVDLGDVAQGSTAQGVLVVTNSTDVRRFARDPINAPGAGIETLSYSFSAPPAGFGLVGGTGPFAIAPANQPALPASPVLATRSHTVTVNTASTGLKTGFLTLSSNAVDGGTIVIQLRANVTAAGPTACSAADIVSIGGQAPADGLLTGDDFNAFVSAFAAGDPLADIVGIGGQAPGDGLVTGDDFNAFIAAFAQGCP